MNKLLLDLITELKRQDEEFRQAMQNPETKAAYISETKRRAEARRLLFIEEGKLNKAELADAVSEREAREAAFNAVIVDDALLNDVIEELKANGDSDLVIINKTSSRTKIINLASEFGLI